MTLVVTGNHEIGHILTEIYSLYIASPKIGYALDVKESLLVASKQILRVELSRDRFL
jgi:hypothetical protein